MKDLSGVYGKMYTEHETTREYKLSAEAKALVTKYIEEAAEERSKGEKNTLRMIMSFHVLFHRLSQGLSLQIAPTPLIILSDTVEMAINYHEHIIQTQRSLLAGVVDSSLLDIMKVIIQSTGPFVSLRRTYMKFPSSRRPSSTDVMSVFNDIHDAGIFGQLKKVGKTNLIYKMVPTDLSEENLVTYDMNARMYKELFDSEDTEGYTQEQRDKYLENHPFETKYDDYIRSTTTPPGH